MCDFKLEVQELEFKVEVQHLGPEQRSQLVFDRQSIFEAYDSIPPRPMQASVR